jgi:hypothetical protein
MFSHKNEIKLICYDKGKIVKCVWSGRESEKCIGVVYRRIVVLGYCIIQFSNYV